MFMTLTFFSVLKGFCEDVEVYKRTTKKQELTIMTYNFENLFDTEDDPLKDDEAYLPFEYKKNNSKIKSKCQKISNPSWRRECLHLDWSPKALKSKMNRLSDVILKSHNWVGPDLLIVQEVENLSVLEKLRSEYLSKHYPYPAILIEGPDERGIDVGIISKLPLNTKPKLHPVTTRGILEAEFKLPDETLLTVFAVHFPSQRAPFKNRRFALDQLKAFMMSVNKKNLVIAAGDMNLTHYELKKHDPFKIFKSQFLVSHQEGCFECKGSHYYAPKKSWSFLDVILVSQNHPVWKLNKKSISVFNQSLYQTNKYGVPEKFNLGKKQIGVSDHWPLKLNLTSDSTLTPIEH